jgi:hypothetical protein
MKIKSKDIHKTHIEDYIVEYEGVDYRYLDYFNEDLKIIDSRLETVDGHPVQDPVIFEAIQNCIDENPNF